MTAAGFTMGASNIPFYGSGCLGRGSQDKTHRHRAKVGGDASVEQENTCSCRRRWSVSTGKGTRLNTWFSTAHDLIAFAKSRGSAQFLAGGRTAAGANGLGYDAGTRQHSTSWTA